MHLFLERVVTNLKDVDVVLNSVADDRELTAMGLDGVKTVTYERLDVVRWGECICLLHEVDLKKDNYFFNKSDLKVGDSDEFGLGESL